jgi:Na+-driven multidrug efflux pump
MLSGLALGILVIFLKSPMVNLFSGLSLQVRQSAETILVIGAATIWFRAFNTVNIVGVLRSGGDTVFSLVMDAGTLWLIGIPFTGLAALVLRWPLEIVYLCTLSEELVKMLIGLPRFRSRKWMNVLTQAKEN